jgi:hypothetical protein
MSLLFIDSFDHYLTGDGVEKYQEYGGGSTIVAGRHGNGLHTPTAHIGLNPTSTRVVVGMAVKPLTLPTQLCVIVDTLDTFSFRSIVSFGLAGRVEAVTDYTFTPVTPSASGLINPGSWYYVEINMLIAPPSSSTLEVRLDGATVINASGFTISTFSPSTYYWDQVRLGRLNPHMIIDDVYVLDGAGATHNTFLGDAEIGVIRPDGVNSEFADSYGWTPQPGVDNYLNVDDQTPDDDATYNHTTTVGTIDRLNMQDVGALDEILGAQLLISGRRTGETFAAIRGILNQAGVDYETADRYLSSTYNYLREPYGNSPSGAAWTSDILNKIRAGYRKTV